MAIYLTAYSSKEHNSNQVWVAADDFVLQQRRGTLCGTLKGRLPFWGDGSEHMLATINRKDDAVLVQPASLENEKEEKEKKFFDYTFWFIHDLFSLFASIIIIWFDLNIDSSFRIDSFNSFWFWFEWMIITS